MNGTSDKAGALGEPVNVVIVGAGSRAMNYASYSLKHPKAMRVVGVVEPDPKRRAHTARLYGLPADRCFESVEALVARPQLADAVINGTLDALHVRTTLPLLRKGYDVLLEKPIGISEEEVLELYRVAEAHERKVMICHVLRYAPFYQALNQVIRSGEIGDVVHVQTEENVDYHHMATAFVRGKFASLERDGSSFLMAKCCHDLDLISWFKTGVKPVRVGSFGRRSQFREDRAPEGAGTRCVTDCPIEATCPYSAKTLYVERGTVAGVRVAGLPGRRAAERRGEAGQPGCRQSVRPLRMALRQRYRGSSGRAVRVRGREHGRSQPCGRRRQGMQDRAYHGDQGRDLRRAGGRRVRRPASRSVDGRRRLFGAKSRHRGVRGKCTGGGDHRLVEDFLRVVRGDPDAGYSTALAHSIVGHVSGFRADVSMATGRTVEIDWDDVFV
ncbi:Gfo/Idh/MocA family protein [Cohnella rhizosphaerae]|uniref:Gfo/Idh/MocA family oxidoreductase n=1 Tax=Cohnella rhizosphaerae TaxID=1457232 RepID=A0A9X4QTT1_9BACL|nr:Gfo/Idh/MocA family oxidoreductase [Cohnella rhizosphaerae]MDG0810749.1 Gfo/Idh/MocA family oxidoreductase [Cohnella rhizosphaerae]